MPQLSYSNSMPVGRVGALADGRHHSAAPKAYAALQQISTINVGDVTTDGDRTVRITTSDGRYFDSTFSAVSKTRDEIGAGIAAALLANEDLNNIVASAVHSTSADTIAVTFVHHGESYSISYPDNPSTHLTTTATQSSARENLPLGIAVARESSGQIRKPQSGDDVFDILGIVRESINEDYANDDGSSGGYPAGTIVPVHDFGSIYVAPEEAVSEGDRVRVRLVATGTEVAGSLRKSGDGTAQITTLTPGAAQHSTQFLLTITMLTGEYAGSSKTIGYLSDANMTATEVCDAIRADLAADAMWSTLITGSGTATCILTAANPEDTFDVIVDQGTVTVDATAAGAPDTILMPPNWRFESDAAAGQPAKLLIS